MNFDELRDQEVFRALSLQLRLSLGLRVDSHEITGTEYGTIYCKGK